MRNTVFFRFCCIALVSLAFFSCNEKEEFVTENISDYYLKLSPGKYISYRVDSLVFTNFGRTMETHRYQLKDQVDAQITDNLGRPAYRIFRYRRDSLGTTPWVPAGTYSVSLLSDQVEVTEDNLRVIKMHMPIRDGFSWKGNKYIPNEPYEPNYIFSNDFAMQDWDFYYKGIPANFSYRNNNYSNVLSVEEIDEILNVPITSPQQYAYKSRSVNKYAKNTGLVYREYELWDYQPNASGSGGPFYTGFGVRMWMIDHN